MQLDDVALVYDAVRATMTVASLWLLCTPVAPLPRVYVVYLCFVFVFKRFDHGVRRASHSVSMVHRQGSIPLQDTLSYEFTNKNLELNTLKMF